MSTLDDLLAVGFVDDVAAALSVNGVFVMTPVPDDLELGGGGSKMPIGLPLVLGFWRGTDAAESDDF